MSVCFVSPSAGGRGRRPVDGGRGVGCGDRPSVAEGSVDDEALARGACSTYFQTCVSIGNVIPP